MAFGRTNIILPLSLLAGFVGVYALLSALYKQPRKKNTTIDEHLQDEPHQDDVPAVENAAFKKPEGKSECDVKASFEVVTEEKIKSLLSLEDECTLAGTTTVGSLLVSPSLYAQYISASISPSSNAGSALPLSFCQTNTCEQKNHSASTSPSANAGSALPLSFCEASTRNQKEEEMHEIISVRSCSATISLMNQAMSSDGELSSAPSFRRWNAATSSLTSCKIQDNSINGVIESTRHETTDLSPVIASPSTEELTNELKMEIEYMKSQLSTYNETFVGLQIRREIGSGAFGRVYEADTRFEKVAIKVLMAEKLATLTEFDYYMNMHEFYEEALLHSDLIHSNILNFEFIISDVPPYGLPGMATEFMSGDLYHYIRKIGLKTWNSVWSIANQVASGLNYMHSKKVVHFDIKSSNILVDYSGSPTPKILTCKVADFGLAVKNYSGVMIINSQRGTTHYMAPEVLRASHSNRELVTEKVDVYSYGILLWELIMGVLPYNRMTDEEIGAHVLNGSRPPVPNCCDNGWRGLIESCWSQDQTQRPRFDQIVERLSCLLGAP